MKPLAFALVGLTAATSLAHAAERKPVLLIIANHHFYYKEYGDTRKALEQAGYTVQVGAGVKQPCDPHPNTGEGADRGIVNPDIALPDAEAANYSAVAFVGGWGASQYQPNFPGKYSNGSYNSSPEVKAAVNRLIVDSLAQHKVVGGLCHGVTVLAWARVDGKSPLNGRKVVGYAGGGPGCTVDGRTYADNQVPSRAHIEGNGGTVLPSRSVGDPRIADDDVMVDGPIVTGENYDSAYLFGQTLAREIGKE
jgi:putative intracellular protease/amidase